MAAAVPLTALIAYGEALPHMPGVFQLIHKGDGVVLKGDAGALGGSQQLVRAQAEFSRAFARFKQGRG